MVLYWFAYNIFTMGQQFYLLRRYHQPLALIDSEHVITDEGSRSGCRHRTQRSRNGAKSNQPRSTRNARSKRKNKKGS